MPGVSATPSGVLREALLDYSREAQRRKRQRSRRRRREARQEGAAAQQGVEQTQQQGTSIGSELVPPDEDQQQYLLIEPDNNSTVYSNRQQELIKRSISESYETTFPEQQFEVETNPNFLEDDNDDDDGELPSVPSIKSLGAIVNDFGDVVGYKVEQENEAKTAFINSLKEKEMQMLDEIEIKSLPKESFSIQSAESEQGVAPSNDGTLGSPTTTANDNDYYDTGSTSCCCSAKACSKKYRVAPEILDCEGYAQSRFVQKVFTVLLIKVLLILGYLTTVEYLDDFKRFYKQSFHYHYISAGIYLLIKTTIRLTKNFRRKNCCLHILLHIMDIIVLSDFLACGMSHWLADYFSVPRKILFSLGGTSLFFIVVGWFVNYDMQDGIMIGSAMIVTGLTATHQILHGQMKGRGFGFDPALGRVADEWICVLVVLAISELIIVTIMNELRSVLIGNRFSVLPSDWFFTGVYII